MAGFCCNGAEIFELIELIRQSSQALQFIGSTDNQVHFATADRQLGPVEIAIRALIRRLSLGTNQV